MHDEIEAFLKENGETGVNAISAGIGKPVSSVQKWLEKQTYFIKTSSRKWDLPERIIGNFDVKAQDLVIRDTNLAIENAVLVLGSTKAKLDALLTVVERINTVSAATNQRRVAGNSKIEKRISEVEKMQKILKSHIDKVPEQYRELLRDLDYVEMTWQLGAKKMDTEINSELTELILGETTELKETTVALFQTYQITRKARPESTVKISETVPHSEMES